MIWGMLNQKYRCEESIEEWVDTGEYRVKLASLSEPGPTVEINKLFHRLYGEPQECGMLNPYIAKYIRFRASALPHSKCQGYKNEVGNIEYRYWPSLKLGYIENVQVNSEVRKKGLGVKLIKLAVEHLHYQHSQHIYAFSVNPAGFRLLTSAGFTDEPPENPTDPWRRWFSIV